MNKYLFTVEWSDYDFWRVFEGNSVDDQAMKKEVIEWITMIAD